MVGMALCCRCLYHALARGVADLAAGADIAGKGWLANLGSGRAEQLAQRIAAQLGLDAFAAKPLECSPSLR